MLQVLGSQAVQPAQPVRAGDAEHSPVGPVDYSETAGQRALLGVRITVMGRDLGVRLVSGDRAGLAKQRTHQLSIHRPCGVQFAEATTFPSFLLALVGPSRRKTEPLLAGYALGPAARSGPAVSAQ